MAPVARELSADWGILEPLQAADSLEGQVQELQAVLTDSANLPVTLIGSSWGAMLGFIVSARFPELVLKLIMVGSPVFDERHAAEIQETRFSRLSEEEWHEAQSLMQLLGDPAYRPKDVPFARLGALFTKADAYDPLTLDIEVMAYQYHVYQRVWGDALELRREDALLELGKKIKCPVMAIHGDHDPHPAEGVERPLVAVVKDFRFILLDRCGHLPWIERYARDRFYAVLRAELTP
jgi:pimeloyl-ACP methyl ester carboxylesterase